MIDPDWAKAFAHDWIDSWNSHDMDRILSHYADEFEMSSPLIGERLGDPSGKCKGEQALRAYWQPSLTADPPLEFKLIDVLVGIDSITLYYLNVGRRVVAETLLFDDSLHAVKGFSQWSIVMDCAPENRVAERTADGADTE